MSRSSMLSRMFPYHHSQEHNCSPTERELLALPVRMGGLGLTNPSASARAEYLASVKVSAFLVSKIIAQSHETPDDTDVRG